ncbi:MAG: hypothetical protein JO197_17880 [Acidobacteria bacterium]|nr:hypothetical protein [Acidobacteriota bacterium]MBV9478975.1 hypothetical protein [Acidobacteriota bacterium]
MTTVINDLTIEPKAVPPAADASGAGGDAKGSGGGAAKSGPELERELEKVSRRRHERMLRLSAY